MSKYKGRKVQIGSSLDELGLRLGLKRIDGESLDDYRKRLSLQVEVKPDPSQKSFIDTISRNVGLFEDDIFEIDLVLDSNGKPVAPSPRVEVSSCYLRVWSNYPDSDPELEVDIYHRGEGYHLGQIKEKLEALTFINVKILIEEAEEEEDSYKYKKSWNLKYGDSDRIEFNYPLKSIRMNRFYHDNGEFKKYIHNCLFTSPSLFSAEKDSHEELSTSGDYYIDYDNGILFSYNNGGGLISFEYREFPYKLVYQPVKVLPFEDHDMHHLKKDYLISDETGERERISLSSYGAKVTNSVLKAYPLQWGE